MGTGRPAAGQYIDLEFPFSKARGRLQKLYGYKAHTRTALLVIACVFVVAVFVSLFYSGPVVSVTVDHSRCTLHNVEDSTLLHTGAHINVTITGKGSPLAENQPLEQFLYDSARMPHLPLPFVDLTAGQRCDVLHAAESHEASVASMSIVHLHNSDGIVTVTIVTRDLQGSNRTYGGDAFRCELIQIDPKSPLPEREFRAYGFSHDHCNGSYTCVVDMRHAAAGTYSAALIRLSMSFTHEVHLVDPPVCGGTIGSLYFDAKKLAEIGFCATNEVHFPNTTIQVEPYPLTTEHLPACTLSSSSKGRWVGRATCFPEQHNATTELPVIQTSPCRDGRSEMRVADAAVWVPYHCKLGYITSDQFVQKAVSAGENRIAILGDSRSLNLWLSLVTFLLGGLTDPETGVLKREDLVLSRGTTTSATYVGKPIKCQSYKGRNMTIELFESYGSVDQYTEFPCLEPRDVVGNVYFNLRANAGTWFEKTDVLFSLPASEQHDVIIMQDGGIHDMFNSFSESRYMRTVRRMISELKTRFRGKRVIYMSLPAAMMRDFHAGYAMRSAYHQWRRAQLGAKMFGEAGFEVWDIHQMTASRADRYFDALHYYPQFSYRRPWNHVPMLLAHELVQDLVNRMYSWH